MKIAISTRKRFKWDEVKMFIMEEERENVKRMILNNKDNSGDLERNKMTGERAGEAKVIKLPGDPSLRVGKA